MSIIWKWPSRRWVRWQAPTCSDIRWRVSLSAPSVLETPGSDGTALCCLRQSWHTPFALRTLCWRNEEMHVFHLGKAPPPAPVVAFEGTSSSVSYLLEGLFTWACKPQRAAILPTVFHAPFVPRISCSAWGKNNHWQTLEWMSTFTPRRSKTIPSLDPHTYYCLFVLVSLLCHLYLWSF